MTNDNRGYQEAAPQNQRVYSSFVRISTWAAVVAVIILALMGLFLA